MKGCECCGTDFWSGILVGMIGIVLSRRCFARSLRVLFGSSNFPEDRTMCDTLSYLSGVGDLSNI